jgi:anti-sigma factor RsiW
MSACPEQHETLVLDAYGELGTAERSAFAQHLAICQGCRDEHQRLLRLLERVREGAGLPSLSPGRARDMARSISGSLESKPRMPWWQWVYVSPSRVIPALAAACIVVISVGWFTYKTFQGPSSEENLTSLGPEKQAVLSDAEVIKNLQLLQDLEVLSKLVRVVDGKQIL